MEATLRGSDRFADPAFPLLVGRYVVDAEVPRHGHDFTELVVVVSGTAEHTVARGRRTLTQRVAPGDVFVLAPGERHGYRPGRGFVVWNVLFTADLLRPDAARLQAVPGLVDLLATEPLFRSESAVPKPLRLPPALRTPVEAALATAGSEIEASRPGWQLVARGAFHRLLVLLARAWSDGGGRQPALAAAQEAAVAEAVAFMERSHGEEDLAVADVAAVAGLSPHWFSAVFAQRTGMSPWQWLTGVRVERAKRLLSESDRAVTAIAFEVGFGDPSYFARVFRSHAGCTPRQWREREGAGE